jgi:hypothetical protein
MRRRQLYRVYSVRAHGELLDYTQHRFILKSRQQNAVEQQI